MKKSAAIGMGLLLTGGTVWAQYLITTVAGGGLPPTAAPALSSPLPQPVAVVTDNSGNVYFAAANCVFKVDASGVLTRVAGSTEANYGGDGGPATTAQLNAPQGLAVDSAGNLYIADSGNSRIRKVAANGAITTVAGNGTPGYTGNGGPATNAELRFPRGVAVDASGSLYIADTANSRIRKVAANGTIATVAGSAFSNGLFGDGGPATSASLNHPYGVALDSAGNIYIADTSNHAVREVTVTNGIINTVAGTGTAGYTGDGGAATGAELNYPYSVVVDSAGNLYIADHDNNVIREVAAASGAIVTIAGNGTYGYTGDGGPATSAELRYPAGAALAAGGNLYIADSGNSRIRQVAAGGTIATLAGNGIGYAGNGGSATAALIGSAESAALDAAGNLYLADSANNMIRKVAPSGIITTVAGNGTAGYSGDGGPANSAQLTTPSGVALDSAGSLYIADTGNSVVRKVALNGTITTVAGNGTYGYSGDKGPATSAELSYPYAAAVDSAGNLYIADTWNAAIRKVAAATGTITTFAGSNFPGYAGDGGSPTAAEINYPYGLALDSSGNLYIADSGNSRIREVSGGTITTVAGSATAGYAGDGGAATSASLSLPNGVAVDAAGNIYIADTGNSVVREVSGGNISTIAGNRGYGESGDGGPATSAQLNSPYDVVLDSAGDAYVTDQFVVRMLLPQGARALLSAAETLPSSLTRGQTGGAYSVAVSNAASAGPTSGTVTVTATVSTGLVLASMSGTGWSCSGAVCTRSDALGAGASYPAINVRVNVAADAPAQVSNQVSVSGGGSTPSTASGLTAVVGGPPAAPALVSPPNTALGVLVAPTLTWSAAAGATSYDVYLGTLSTPPLVTNTTGTSYVPPTLSVDTTYYWQIVARDGSGSASSATWSFTTGAALAPLLFVPVTPCRVADTRVPAGQFGGPTMTAGSTRSFPIPQGGCSIPASAQAYSVNVTVVPDGPLGFLSLWPTGQPQPVASTLNSWGGIVVANAAIVPAGTGGAVSVFVSNDTDVILDVNGYFAAAGAASPSAFYAATPCRIADTRGPAGQFGGPSLYAGQTRSFSIPSSLCQTPAGATAYSLNVTAVPDTNYLGFLSAWPTGQVQPNVSTLNSWTGKVVANAAIVPAGTNGSISAFVTDPTDVILDINGYFSQPGGAGALSFYPVVPCRVADTRWPVGPFGGPEMTATQTRSFAIPASGCYVPSTAVAYSVNITVVPDARLSFLSAWPAGLAQPVVSTLNSWDGSVVANAAIVPAGTGGAISIFVTDNTQVILDINGYFAP